MTEIKLKNVQKSFGAVDVIRGVSLDIRSGEFCVFVGPSGCGKSTLLRIIAGLEEVTSGEVSIDEAIVNKVPASARGLAMVFQSYALYPHMSVYKNMAFGLENTKMPRSEIKERVTAVAKLLQLEDYLGRKPKALSGGQRQRVAIGRAIVREPKAFLFDEPLSNLDAELRVAMRKELAALHGKIGGTMIYVTHDQVEAMTLADRIVVLQAGQIEQIGTPLELYNYPKNIFVAGFIGSPSMNFFKARAEQGDGNILFDLGGWMLEAPALEGVVSGETYQLGIRPEHLRLGTADEFSFKAKAVLNEQLGGETYIYCEVENQPQFILHQPGQLEIEDGETIPILITSENLHIFDAQGQTIANGIKHER